MLLEFKPFEATSVYRFIDPDTQFKYIADSLPSLVQLITTYRANNRFPPIEELPSVLENYFCTLPENCGKCRKRKMLKRGLYAYIKGGLVLLQNLWYDKTVTLEVADKRAFQCSTCSLNIFPDKGPFVRWSDKIAEASVGDKKTKHNDLLGNCSACSCCLRAKVWYTGPFNLSENERMSMEAVACWQLKENA